MHGEGFFFQAFVYLTAAVICVPLAKRLGLGSVIGYLFAGVVIGPYALALVGGGESQGVMHFAEFGVVMMLFLVGLELEPHMLWRMRRPMLGLGGLQVVVTAAAIAGLALASGHTWQVSVALGLTLALSSTALVLQTLQEKGIAATAAGRSSFAVLLFQDVAVIPVLALFPLLAIHALGSDAPVNGVEAGAAHGGGTETGVEAVVAAPFRVWLEQLPDWAGALVVLSAIVAVVAIGRFLVGPMFRVLARARMRELLTGGALLLIVGIALLMNEVGLSPALGTFLAGVVLANSEFKHELEAEIEPFKGLLLGLFFISVGASIDFGLIAGAPLTIVGLVTLLVVVKLVIVLLLGRAFGLGVDQRVLFAFLLAQGGEFAFVLFSFGVQSGVWTPEFSAPWIAVVALSMVVAPFLLLLYDRVISPRFGVTEKAEQPADDMHETAPVIIAGFGRFGHIVGRFLLANNVPVTVLDHDTDQVELLRRVGLKVFYGDATRPDLLAAAGAEQAKLLILATDDPGVTLEIAKMARKHFPGLKILARARGRQGAYDLIEAGVPGCYRETLDTSLRLGEDALRHLGHRAHQAHRAAQRFRRYDEDTLRELARLRHDSQGYFHRARERAREIEELLRAELGERDISQDAAWDASVRRAAVAGGHPPESPPARPGGGPSESLGTLGDDPT